MAQRAVRSNALTPREWEIARLLARGQSNRAIAGELVISTSTVERHVANILGKLDIRSRAEVAAWIVAPESRTNLPVELSPFIGRAEQVHELAAMLRKARLVTLTGAGGIGKTRLALRVAAELLNSFPDGVWLVDLAPLADPRLIPQVVAATLGVREQPDYPLRQTLADVLRSKCLLLVLDNCEHLVLACAELAESLLRASPELRILATSREVLRIGGEIAWRVPPLGLPPPLPAGLRSSSTIAEPKILDSVEQSDAVRLFVTRAAAAIPGFALTRANMLTIAELCHRLDGLALAIELAAARVNALGLEQLASRLADRFGLLTGGSRTALPRQQTLRATLEWSYALLSEPERRLFERLTVFAGGWSLEAAEVVCAGDGIRGEDVLQLLTQLIDKSLVVPQAGVGGEVRYRLLETLRDYGREWLSASGAADAIQRRHVGFYLAFAERAEPELASGDQAIWLGWLEQDHDNLRAALRWTVERGEHELALRLAGTLSTFWWLRGHLSEGQHWLGMLLALTAGDGAAEAATRAKALGGAAVLATDQGDYGRAALLAEQSLALFSELGDKEGSAWALHNLGQTAAYQTEYDRATALLQKSLDLFRDLGDTRGIAWSLRNLGRVARDQVDYSRAAALVQESLALFRQLGDKRGIADALYNLGPIASFQGDYAQATVLLEESLTVFRELGNKRGSAAALTSLGRVARCQSNYGRARDLLEESLGLFRELGNKRGSAWALDELGHTAANAGDYARAIALFGEALPLWREVGDAAGTAECVEALSNLAALAGEADRGPLGRMLA